MNSKGFNLLLTIVGLGLLIFLIINFDFSYLSDFRFSLSFVNVSALIILIGFIFLIRTYRWQIYLKSVNIHITFKDAYLIVVPSIAAALFTPAQTGDALKIEFLKKRKKVLRRDSIATIFVEKFMDLLLIFIIFLIAISYFSLEKFNINYTLIFTISIVAIILFSLLIYFLHKKYSMMKPIIKNVKKILSDPNTIFMASALTLVYWIVTALNWFFVARVVNIDINFLQITGIMAIGTVLGLITFIPGALGVIEFSSIFLLTTFIGATSNQAIVFALSYRLYSIISYLVAYSHLLIKHK